LIHQNVGEWSFLTTRSLMDFRAPPLLNLFSGIFVSVSIRTSAREYRLVVSF
jgi:hypothetical protein